MKSCPECTATYPDDYALCPKDGAPLEETSVWQIGTVVRGKYRILARLGEGGMAIVYKAHHELLDELRALKVIKPELARDSEFMSRFRNEAIMARKLNHPNAVRAYDLEIGEDGLPFIAMEFVLGDTLKTLIEATGPLPVSLVLDITLHVCEALDAAHKLGLIHRDIKPENIVLLAQRQGPPVAKILDFGISRLREQTAEQKGLTQTGTVIGTPEYMSPEQVLGKRCQNLDGRSDLYSLGVVMYRMLTGELPFDAETTGEMMLQHLQAVVKAPHQLKPELAIPEPVSAIVMKALEKNRDKRFSTGAEMAAAIRKAKGSSTVPTRQIDWDALSSAAASFGTEKAGAAGRSAANAPRPAASAAATPGPRMAENTMYRTSARIGPPRREFPTRAVLLVAAVVLLLGGAIAAFRHFEPVSAAKPIEGAATARPAKTPSPSSPQSQNNQAPASTEPAAAPTPQAATKDNPPTPEQKAEIVKLNSMGAIYYREGGCDKALSTYQQVLVIDPHDPEAYAAVEKCMSKARLGRGAPLRVPFPTPPPSRSPIPDTDSNPNP